MPYIKVSGMFEDYYNLLNIRLQYLQQSLQGFKSERLALVNKDRSFCITVEI